MTDEEKALKVVQAMHRITNSASSATQCMMGRHIRLESVNFLMLCIQTDLEQLHKDLKG